MESRSTSSNTVDIKGYSTMKRDLSKLKIPLTNKERQEKSRAKLKQTGGRALTVWLDHEAAQMFDELLNRYPRLNKKKLIAESIRALYNSSIETDS